MVTEALLMELLGDVVNWFTDPAHI